MSTAVSAAAPAGIISKSRSGEAPIPWYIWCAVAAVTSVMIGGHWDVSWHSSIGRDTFWTPAHMAIYLGGVLTAVVCGYLILSTTFDTDSPLRRSSVRVLGFRAPLGAFIGAWGGLTMLTSAPFDNWWHNAYGLDVQIVSPPHMVLFLGVYSVVVGAMVLLSGHANRVEGQGRRKTQLLLLYLCGTGLVMFMFTLMEFTTRVKLHSSLPYVLVGAVASIPLAVAATTTDFRWAMTVVAGIYTLLIIALIQILPLFAAQPKLGPVYQHVTHFIPPQFPILLVAPALALDVLWSRARDWNKWALSLFSGAVFVLLLLAVEWPFASFLQSPAARNRFFGAMYFWYGLSPLSYSARYLFYSPETTLQFWTGIALAVAAATLGIRFGISRGDWMRRVKR